MSEQTIRNLAEAIPKIVRELNIGPESPWPIIDTQALSFDLLNNIRNASHANIFIVGAELADHLRYIQGEDYFEAHGESPLSPWLDVDHSKSGREAGYVGMVLGLEIYAHPDLAPNMIVGVKLDAKATAVIGYVKI